MGNHDYCWPHLWRATQHEKASRWKEAYAPYFVSMWPGSMSKSFAGGSAVLLNHFPYVGDSGDEDRYAEHRPEDHGDILLHGHVHDVWKTRRTNNGTLMVNVGVDVWDYIPVHESEIVELIREMDPSS
jgi:calcineurin-like phosphoesterase family protein